MTSTHRGARVVVALAHGFVALSFLSLVFRYAHTFGTDESLFVIVYLLLAYWCSGIAIAAVLPRASVVGEVASVGVGLAILYFVGIFYYLAFGTGAIAAYMAIVLMVGLFFQMTLVGVFKVLAGLLRENRE